MTGGHHPQCQPARCRFKGLTPEDMLVYQCIQSAGNMGEALCVASGRACSVQLAGCLARHSAGIWTRDMKQRTNLQQVEGRAPLAETVLPGSLNVSDVACSQRSTKS